MLEKFVNILKILTNKTLYQELKRLFLHFYYEHVVPLTQMSKGTNVNVHPSVSFHSAKNISLEDNVYIGPHCCIWGSENAKIIIKENTEIAIGTFISSLNHGFYQKKSFNDQPPKEKNVVIENNVWIGANCVIVYGVTIGEFSVIGAGSVVTKDIPPYSIAAGKSRDLTVVTRKPFRKPL